MGKLAARTKKRSISQGTPNGVQNAHMQAAAMRMRIDGYTYEEIGERFGLARDIVFDLISKGISRTVLDSVEQFRNIELIRLEALHKIVWKRINQGRVELIVTALRIMERRSKLLGLDAPERHDILLNEVDRLAEETGLDKKKILAQVDDILRDAKGNKTVVYDSRWAK
jgi:hypothetical protein